MLEQAIVDAKALREAAVKSAEANIVEKYNDEVRTALTKLLEQDDELGLGMEPEEEVQVDSTAMEQVPMAHLSDEEEDVVVVDLDDIIAAAESEEGEEPAVELDRDEIADEVGLPLDDAPFSRTDEEINIEESELVEMFKELLVVDVPQVELERAQERLTADQVEQDEAVEAVETDGMDKKDAEDLERDDIKNNAPQQEALKRENKNLKGLLEQVKNKLQEINLQNARLLYANRVLGDSSLNEQQKTKIAELVSGARSVEEAKMVYETLQKTMAGITKDAPQSLSEVVSKRSSVILSGNRKEERTTESSPTYSRWATLAAINNKDK
tara:strand:+ start:543 stop:1520 length:978 start_codon:yes stop_codon:yes gene_type:complete